MSEATAICLRCGAPAGGDGSGGKLRLATGLERPKRGGIARPRKVKLHVHADPAYCRKRMTQIKRSEGFAAGVHTDVAR